MLVMILNDGTTYTDITDCVIADAIIDDATNEVDMENSTILVRFVKGHEYKITEMSYRSKPTMTFTV